MDACNAPPSWEVAANTAAESSMVSENYGIESKNDISIETEELDDGGKDPSPPLGM